MPEGATRRLEDHGTGGDGFGPRLFLGVHTLPAQRELRARVIASMGEGGYKAGYALVSVIGIALIAWGFAHYRATG